MTIVHFGSAHLLNGDADDPGDADARMLIEAAIAAGARRLDTAPLYGRGRCEALVAEISRSHPAIGTTTKVGLEPAGPPSSWRLAAGALLRRLPSAPVAWLQARRQARAASAQARQPSGRFAVAAVQASIERSLARFGQLDRLLLHEVHPADLSDELLGLLKRSLNRGEVGALGVATGNAVTVEALRRGRGLFTVAHLSIDPLGPAVPDPRGFPDVHWVGHGALGAGGRTLAQLKHRLATDAALRSRWAAAVRHTPFAVDDGAALGLLARAALAAPELVVATRRPDRVADTVRAASGALRLPWAARAAIDDALGVRRSAAIGLPPPRTDPTVRKAPP